MDALYMQLPRHTTDIKLALKIEAENVLLILFSPLPPFFRFCLNKAKGSPRVLFLRPCKLFHKLISIYVEPETHLCLLWYSDGDVVWLILKIYKKHQASIGWGILLRSSFFMVTFVFKSLENNQYFKLRCFALRSGKYPS